MAADSTAADETLEDFKNSFNYGTRADLAFKFLARLGPGDAGSFFQELLRRLGETIDDGDADRLIQFAYQSQAAAYANDPKPTYDDTPFTPLQRPLREARLALLSSAGVFHADHDPRPFGVEDMTEEQAMARILDFLRSAPELSAIPAGTPVEQLRVRHGGYDVRGARKDPNVVFPTGPLRELQRAGVIGELADPAYSFVGASAQGQVKEVAPAWADMLLRDRVQAVLLVPA